jgi:2,3-dimethylmalate lyase
VASRRNDRFMIIARTDALSVRGFDEAMRRARHYRAAGADILFIESPTSVDQLRQIPQLLESPVMVNQIEGGRTPIVAVHELEAMGYKLVAYALTTLMASVRAVQRVLENLRKHGAPDSYTEELARFDELDELLGFPEVREWEKRFR